MPLERLHGEIQMKIIANYHHAPCAFAVGQIVTRQAFVDCFGVSHILG